MSCVMCQVDWTRGGLFFKLLKNKMSILAQSSMDLLMMEGGTELWEFLC